MNHKLLDTQSSKEELSFQSPGYVRGLPPEFVFAKPEANVMFCISKYQGAVRYEGLDYGALVFSWAGKDTLALDAHRRSVFRGEESSLFFVDFSPLTFGGTVRAFELSTGLLKWETRLTRAGCPMAHSIYFNAMTIDLSAEAVIVTAQESYRDYAQILDRKTGAVLAYKIYARGYDR